MGMTTKEKSPVTLTFIALGSNLCNPQQQVLQAIHSIALMPDLDLVRASSLYRTAPIGYDQQPDFINAVIAVNTRLTAQALLKLLLDYEQQAGRVRPFPNAPRVLDLDLLLYGDLCMHTETLTLPHPRMHTRAFVLSPLAEIAPDLCIPGQGSVQDCLAQCSQQDIERLSAENAVLHSAH